MLSLKLGGLSRGELWGCTVYPGGGGLSALQWLGGAWRRPPFTPSCVCRKYYLKHWPAWLLLDETLNSSRGRSCTWGILMRELCFYFLIIFLWYFPKDFVSPHVKLFSERNFGELGPSVDLLSPIINMEDMRYGNKTQSANVMGGV